MSLPLCCHQATIYKYGAYRAYIKNRKGFIKYALQYGYSITPIFVFGEEKSFYALESFLPQRLAINKFKVPGAVFWSWLGFLPDCTIELNHCVAKPMILPHIPSPTSEQVDEWHGKYVTELVRLFDAHKEKYAEGGKTATLELW